MGKLAKEWMKDLPISFNKSNLISGITIGDAARETGLSGAALRKYEASGLILFARTEKGHRRVSHEDLIRIKLIQHLIKKKGLNLEGIRRLWALIPCWELKECATEVRANCKIFIKGTNEPCWVVHKSERGCNGHFCRECEVYRMAAVCTEDLKGLLLNLLVKKRKNS
jgi:MerR family transcriptional regulator, heat shock protein HspR